jgi:7SK snRNA methylphosphate capping enzyme
MSLIPSGLITDKNVLDIGCNSGNFSILLGKNSMFVLDIVGTLYHTDFLFHLALKHKPAHMLGVDIDERLIHSAHMNLKQVYSLRDADSDIINTDIGLRYHYFPTSMSTMFGFIGTLPKTKHLTEFPNNVQFKAVDWLKTETEIEKFDTILA